MSFLSLAQELISIDSSEEQGFLRVCDFFREQFSNQFLNVQINRNQSENFGLSLYVEPQAHCEKSLSFVGFNFLNNNYFHELGLWTKTGSNPHRLTVDGEKIYGIGVASSKLDFLVKVIAAQSFLEERPDIASTFKLYGGLSTLQGKRQFLSSLRQDKMQSSNRIEFALVGEPSGLNLVDSGLGLIRIEITFPFNENELNYKKNHDEKEGGVSQLRILTGDTQSSFLEEFSDHNPIKKMFSYINKLPENTRILSVDGGVSGTSVPSSVSLEFDWEGSEREDYLIVKKLKDFSELIQRIQEKMRSYFLLRNVQTVMPGINLGKVYSFEEGIRFEGSCRLSPIVSMNEYDEVFHYFRTECKKLEASFRVLEIQPWFSLTPEHPVLRASHEILKTINKDYKISQNLNSSFANKIIQQDIPAIIFGAGEFTNLPNESVKIVDLERAQMFYKKLFKRYCQ